MIKIEKNEFATDCFKRNIYLLEIPSNECLNNDYSKEIIRLVNELNSLNKYPYIICKQKLSSLPIIHALESTGFQMTSVDIELKTEVNKPLEIINEMNNEFCIEKFDQKYEDSFTNSINKTQRFFDSTHFYKSPYLDNRLCDYFYKEWILRNLWGRTNENYIATDGKEIIGFILGNKNDQKIDIDLLWVNENFRNAGIGKCLILSLIKNSRCNEITVKTQITNFPAVKLYTKIGFSITEVFAVYHRSNQN